MKVKGNVYTLSQEEFRNRLQGSVIEYDNAIINDDALKRLDNQFKLLSVVLLSENLKLSSEDAVKVFNYCEDQHLAIIDVLERRIPLLRILGKESA